MSADPRQLKRALRRHLLTQHPDQNLASRLITLVMNARMLGQAHAEEHAYYSERIDHQPHDLWAGPHDQHPAE